MSTLSSAPLTRAGQAGVRTEALEQKSHAVWWWAATGVFFTALQSWIFWQWYADGDMKRVLPGVTPVPRWMDIAQGVNSWTWGLAIVATLYWFVIRPWFKTGRLSFDGIFILAWLPMWWQDALPSYNNLSFSYNSNQFNLGSWSCHIPGWQSPGGCLLSEPLAWDLSFYIVLSALTVIFATRWMHYAKAKNPSVSLGQLFFRICLFITVADFVLEESWLAMGMYQYGGNPENMSVFNGTQLKFPLYEPIFICFYFFLGIAFYYFRDDKGQTIAERGLDQLDIGQAGKQWLRFFALAGATNLIFFAGFSVPGILVNLQDDAWSPNFAELSYFTNGMCGEGTLYACGGKNIATPRAGLAVNIGPNGELTMPPGTVPPKVIPLKRTAD